MILRLLSIAFSASFFSLCAHREIQSLAPASGWYNYSDTTVPTRKDWLNSFTRDCAQLAYQNEHIPVHTTNNNTLRIASYNIHFWCKPHIPPFQYKTGNNRHTIEDIESNFDTIISVIKTINADVLCLQEVLMFNSSLIHKSLKDLGYEHIYLFCEANWSEPFCIMIASKYPFLETPHGKTFDINHDPSAHPLEKHCFLRATLSLAGNKKITIYTTHLDCHDNSERIRYEQVKEMISDSSPLDNTIICGDFNAVRSQDLQYSIGNHTAWDLLNADNLLRTKVPTQTKALTLFATHEFEDCFSKGKIAMPKFSVWNGTIVDFMFLNRAWNLPIEGCYFYYSSASDHLPVILDIKI
jgi:endonuclease/exonuclease/phosphatase family metal-dependent hydrolase